MAIKDQKLGPDSFDEEDIESYLALARVHGEETDTDEWIAALEDIGRVAWRLMSEEQKETFRAEPEIIAITDNFGDFADDQNADF
ncbi:MAG TPA: hypothetical protein VHX12_14795 [Acidisoma sp.]|jgi:hypothetical protein|nr:hypothetical protein [Acidisoma sp.]